MFTTNVEFSRWGTVFVDDKIAAAIVDRVAHHGRLVEFGGPATGSRSSSCSVSQEASGAPVTEPEKMRAQTRKFSATISERGA